MIFIFVLILLLVVIYINRNNFTENFNNLLFYPMSSNWFFNFIPYSNGYTNLPWWNSRLGNTTNMSYDLRGDPLIIPRTNYLWNNSSIYPIYNKNI